LQKQLSVFLSPGVNASGINAVGIVEEEDEIVFKGEGAYGCPSSIGVIDAKNAAIELEAPFSSDRRVRRTTPAE
jgi:hypothetical protein